MQEKRRGDAITLTAPDVFAVSNSFAREFTFSQKFSNLSERSASDDRLVRKTSKRRLTSVQQPFIPLFGIGRRFGERIVGGSSDATRLVCTCERVPRERDTRAASFSGSLCTTISAIFQANHFTFSLSNAHHPTTADRYCEFFFPIVTRYHLSFLPFGASARSDAKIEKEKKRLSSMRYYFPRFLRTAPLAAHFHERTIG